MKSQPVLSIGLPLIIIVIVISSFAATIRQLSKPTVISPVAEAASIVITPTPRITNTPTPFISQLADVVEPLLPTTAGTYAIYIKQLQTGEKYAVNDHKSFPAASLYKLWIMATVYNLMQDGTLTPDMMLTESIPALNRAFGIDPESAELTEGTVSFSIKDALFKMITVSHNYAALALSKKVKIATGKDFLTNYGFMESSFGEPPKTTASDIGLFFEKLNQGTLINRESSDAMLTLLKKQELNNKIPRLLPQNTVIAHKTGELGSVTHDAGIIYTPNGSYVLVVLTETPDPASAETTISRISAAVYTYFSGTENR